MTDLIRRVPTNMCPCISPCTDQKQNSWCFVKDDCEDAERNDLTALTRGPWKYCDPNTDAPKMGGGLFQLFHPFLSTTGWPYYRCKNVATNFYRRAK